MVIRQSTFENTALPRKTRWPAEGAAGLQLAPPLDGFLQAQEGDQEHTHLLLVTLAQAMGGSGMATKYPARGGAPAQNPFSPSSGNSGLHPQLLGNCFLLFNIVLGEVATLCQRGACDLI